MPPSLRRPQPVTVAFMPISRLSVSGRQMGLTCGANSSGCSSLTSARSYSYVKKLYFGCTTFLATPRSMYGSCSCTCEKSYSPTRMRICEISKLKWEGERERGREVIWAVLWLHCTATTHSSTQCPAVAIQFSLIKAPPQRWVLEKPKNEVRRTDTCQGQRPKAALLPPTMRVSGRVSIGTPHSAYSEQKEGISFKN